MFGSINGQANRKGRGRLAPANLKDSLHTLEEFKKERQIDGVERERERASIELQCSYSCTKTIEPDVKKSHTTKTAMQ